MNLVRSLFKDTYNRLTHLPKDTKTRSLLGRAFPAHDSLFIDHLRSHLPQLVQNLIQNSPSFARNTSSIAALYDLNGVLRPESNSLTSLGNAQAANLPRPLRISDDASPIQHIMLASDDDDFDDDDEDGDMDEYYKADNVSDSSQDRLEPIVISSSSSDDEISTVPKHINFKKRKRRA